MIHQKEIQKLIENGFDLELISFELNIPIEQIIQYKKDLERNNRKTVQNISNSNENSIDKRNNYAHSKMKQMRQRYQKLYSKSYKTEMPRPKQLSQEEIEIIDAVIDVIEAKIQEIHNLSSKERRKAVSSILSEVKKIENYQLPMEQAEKLYMLLNSDKLQNLNISPLDLYLNRHKSRIANNFAKAIDFIQNEINSIEELQALEKKITGTMLRENPISIGGIKSRITNRIQVLQQQRAIDKIRTNIPANIASIISDLVSGNIDIHTAKEVIKEETKSRLENRPKTNFTLTEKQIRMQIFMQIRTAIIDDAEKYHIKNPQKMILQMQELAEGELDLSIRAVVKNLIARKDYETAKNICEEFLKEENGISNNLKSLRNEIRNAEISDIVLAGINMQGTLDEERSYFELIERGLKLGRVNLRAVSLGKSKDGLRSITLADIWETEETRKK